MPVIYDVLPALEKEVISVLHDFMKADNGALHTWEIAIFLPACNAFLHYLDGVNVSLKSDNYVSATANLRGLIESLGAVVYDGTANLNSAGYDRFLKRGRLPKWSDEDSAWHDLGPRESVQYAQMVVTPELNLKKVYDDCCDLLHFSSKHMSFLGGFEAQKTVKERLTTIKIGTKDKIPVAIQRQMIELCATLTNALGYCIREGIEEKNRRLTKRN